MSSIAYARRPRSRRSQLPALACLAAVAAAGWTVLNRPHGESLVTASAQEEAPPAPALRLRPELAWIFAPAPVLGDRAASGFVRDLPVLALNTSTPASLRPSLVAEAAPARLPTPAAVTPVRRVASAEPTLVPLPIRRPTDLPTPGQPQAQGQNQAQAQAAPQAPMRVAARRAMPRTRDVFRAAIAEEPSFLERLFGGNPDSASQGAPQALAYANPDSVAPSRNRLVPGPSASTSEGTAVYDISASTVTLPSGEVLEAHSGYGNLMDDPRYVHVRMRGATPPGTYEMREREAPFHGVRAIRLTPVGGSAAIHGRDGILAHTYMLRAQPGASNGCVVFRDYDRFLRAYLRGEVRRLIVVAGNRSPRIDLADRGR